MRTKPIGVALAAALSAALSSACASTSGSSTTEVRYYEGESAVTLPDGRQVPGGPVLARRTVDPGRALIVEEVISSGPPGEPPREFVVEMEVSAARFTLRERSGAFTGEGALTGPAWQWTAWTSTSTLPDGVRVESRDEVVDGALVVHKVVLAPDGAPIVTTDERLAPIDAARYDTRRRELLEAR